MHTRIFEIANILIPKRTFEHQEGVYLSTLSEEEDAKEREEKARSDKMLRILVIIFVLIFAILVITGLFFAS